LASTTRSRVTGLSTWCGAGGWRLGIVVFPRGLTWLRDAMAAVASETYTSTSAPIQHAAVQAFTPDVSIDRYLVDARRVLRSIGNALAGIIGGTGARLLPERQATSAWHPDDPGSSGTNGGGVGARIDL
jgi:aspartate/methionine/tyrosine aminotransferase